MSKQRQSRPRVGIDIGKVIIGPVLGGRADTSFLRGDLAKALETRPAEGALEGVAALVTAFAGQAWLISKARPNTQMKTKHWLRHWDFYAKTGLPPGNLRFCLERRQKAGHCKQLRITHFIDDRLDVLAQLRDLVPHLYLFGEQPDLDGAPDWLTLVIDWEQTTEVVIRDLA